MDAAEAHRLPSHSGRVGHHALHRDRRIRACPARCRAVVCIRDRDRKAIGIEEQFLVIETQASLRREWSVSAIGIDLTRPEIRNEHVPVVIGAMGARSSGMVRTAEGECDRRTAAARCASRVLKTH